MSENILRLRYLREQAETAQVEYTRRELTLYRADGQPVYGEAEHKERLEALRQERAQKLEPVEREAQQIGERARQRAQAAGGADPASGLSPEELAKANGLRAFTHDFVEDASLGEVVDRLRAVALEGDRASRYAHLQAVEKRLRRERGSSGRRPQALRHAQTLEGELLPELRAALGSSDEATRQKREAAEAEAKAAGDAEIHIGNLKVGARTLYQRLYKAV